MSTESDPNLRPLRQSLRPTGQVEAELGSSEEKYRRLFEVSSDAIWLLDAETLAFEDVNDAALRLYGYTRDEALQLKLTDISAEPEKTPASARLASAGKTVKVPLRYHRKRDGTVFPVEVSIGVFHLGGRQKLIGAIRDITERMKTEAELQQAVDVLQIEILRRELLQERMAESEAQYRLLFDCNPEPMWVIASDTLAVLAVNEAVLSLYGYTRAELLAMTVKDVRPPEDIPSLMSTVAGLTSHAESGVAVGVGEWRHVKKDGTIINVQTYLSPISFQGRKAWLAATRDVTERKRAEQQIAFQASLLDQVRHGVIALGLEGRVFYWNGAAERMFGWTAAEAIGQPVGDVTLPLELREQSQQGLTRMGQAGEWEGEQLAQRKDGTTFPIYGSTARIRDAGGQLAGLVGVAIDITERKRDQEELQHAHTELKKHARNTVEAQEAERRRVARELHDGVNQILSSVKLRLETIGEAPARHKCPPGQDLGRVKALLDQAIQEVRRISENLRPLALDELGLAAAIRSLSDDFRERCGVALKLRCSQLPQRLSDEIELALFRIVQEALANVERHAGAGSVKVRLHYKHAQLRLEVKDDGTGFDLNAVAPGTGGHLGLGLDNMRQRAMLVGGELSLESAPGMGTTILVRIPIPDLLSTLTD